LESAHSNENPNTHENSKNLNCTVLHENISVLRGEL